MKITVVGPGLIGNVHISLIEAHPNFRLVSIVAPDHPLNHATAAKSGVPLFDTLGENIRECRPDAVIIASPNEFHFQQALECVECGIPVLVEKPITATLSEAKHLVDSVENSGVPALVGHHRTHSPLLESAQQIISSGDLGKLVSIYGSAQYLKPPRYFEAGPWRTKEGGGPIMINLIHEIGIMRSLLGEISAVHAFASNAIRNFEVEDTATINLRFASGALGTFVLSDTAASSNSWEQTSGENPTFPMYDENCYTITGTSGALSFPSMRVQTYAQDVEPSWTNRQIERRKMVLRADPLRLQLDHFYDVATKRASPRVSARDGYYNLLVIECIRQSIKSGQTVDVLEFEQGNRS